VGVRGGSKGHSLIDNAFDTRQSMRKVLPPHSAGTIHGRASVRHEVQLYLVNESLTLNMLTQHIKYRVLSEYQVY
jgi:hypothetical protein